MTLVTLLMVGALCSQRSLADDVSSTNASSTAAASDALQVPEPYTAHFRRAMRYLRTTLRNPPTLSFAEVRAVKFTKTICIIYRAQNGFGGMSVGHFAYIPSNGYAVTDDDSSFQEDWHHYCGMYKTVDITPFASAELKALESQ